MKIFKFNILLFLIFIIISMIGIVNCQESGSTTTEPIDDDTFCSGNSAETCISAGSCCLWCGIPKNNQTDTISGVCIYVPSINQCPVDVMNSLGNKCQDYLSTTCKCNFRNQTNTNANSNSAFSIYNQNNQNNNYLQFISITIATLILILITLYI